MLAIAVLLLLTNLLAFIQFGADKRRALTQDQRIPEQNLLMMAFLGGYFGAKAGQYLFRHKTRKQPFGRRLNRNGLVGLCLIAVMAVPVSRHAVFDLAGQGLAMIPAATDAVETALANPNVAQLLNRY